MRKLKLLLVAASALLCTMQSFAGIVTTDQYKFLFDGLWTSTYPSTPAVTVANSTTAGNTLFGVGSAAAPSVTGNNVLFSGGGSGGRGAIITNLNGGAALSTTKKEVVEFDWFVNTAAAADAMAYNAIGLSDASKNPIFVFAVEAWTSANSGLHFMNLQRDSLSTAWLLKAAKYSGASDYKTDCANIYASSWLGADFTNNKTYHIKAKLDFNTHLIDSMWVTRSDDATKVYLATNIAFLSTSANSADKLSAAATRGKNQTNSGNGGNSSLNLTIDNYSVYTWEMASTSNVIVNFYDADSPGTLVTSVTRANQAIGGIYSATSIDKTSFTFGGNYCIYSSTLVDNATITADGLAHIDITVKKYPTATGTFTWIGTSDGTWNELNANFTTDGSNSVGYQPGNAVLFPETGSNKTVSMNDVVNLGANDLSVSGDGYTIGGSGTLTGTGKINVNLSGSQAATFNISNAMTGTAQIAGGNVTLSKNGSLGTSINATGVSTLIPGASGIVFPTSIFNASSIIDCGAKYSSISGITAPAGVRVAISSGYNTAGTSTYAFGFAAAGTLSAGSELELNGTETENKFGMTSASATYLANAKITLRGAAFLFIDANQGAASTINVGTLSGEADTKLGWGKSSAADRDITWSVGALNESSTFAGTITNTGGYNSGGSMYTGNNTNLTKAGTGVLTFSGKATTHNGSVAVNGGELKVTGLLGKATTPFTVSGTSILSAQDTGKIVASTLVMGGTDTLLIAPKSKVTVSTATGTIITNVVIQVAADTTGVLVVPDATVKADTLIVKEIVSPTGSKTFKIVNSASATGLDFNYVILPSDKYSYNKTTGILTFSDVTTGLNSDNVNPSLKAYVINRNLIVTGADSYEVYNVQGLKVATISVNTLSTQTALLPGVYVVKSADKVQKVLVK